MTLPAGGAAADAARERRNGQALLIQTLRTAYLLLFVPPIPVIRTRYLGYSLITVIRTAYHGYSYPLSRLFVPAISVIRTAYHGYSYGLSRVFVPPIPVIRTRYLGYSYRLSRLFVPSYHGYS